MSTHHRATSPQWAYLDGELRKRGLTTGDLTEATGLPRSCLTLLRRGRSPRVPTARAIAAFLGVSTLDVLVGTRVITEEEAQRPPAEMPDPTTLTDQELLIQLRERLRHRLWLLSFLRRSQPPAATGDNSSVRLIVESEAETSGNPRMTGRPDVQ
ncbi:helix-turn-helix domain-containing protein [Saccharothrix variisporea]|uniref:helix-turn-helix domain-containing protein n=1 Tax=Saccharothrix variisporea TaxID=543527 RepID=UPI001FE68875|nr:helix-turn-helix transcriptional regulator [Saccharothrix variisporea]